MAETDRLYLIGFMGSGKTTVGRAFAARRGLPFIDLDLAFEAMTGRTIRETFETHGEPWFREREAELLRGTARLPRVVVALGGGTFVLPENAAFVKAHGRSVFLDVPFDLISERLEGKAADRPLFSSLDAARALYDARLPFYKMADWTIPVNRETTVEHVVDRLESAQDRPEPQGSGGQ